MLASGHNLSYLPIKHSCISAERVVNSVAFFANALVLKRVDRLEIARRSAPIDRLSVANPEHDVATFALRFRIWVGSGCGAQG